MTNIVWLSSWKRNLSWNRGKDIMLGIFHRLYILYTLENCVRVLCLILLIKITLRPKMCFNYLVIPQFGTTSGQTLFETCPQICHN